MNGYTCTWVPLVPSLYCPWNASTIMCRASHLRNPHDMPLPSWTGIAKQFRGTIPVGFMQTTVESNSPLSLQVAIHSLRLIPFRINSMSEWILIAWGAAECNYVVIPNCMRNHAIDINLAKLTVHYNKYEYVWDGQVHGIQVCNKIVVTDNLKVYNTLDSLQ